MKESKAPGRPFQKGNKAGKGRPKMSPEQKAISKKIKSYDGKLIVAKYCMMEYPDLLKAVKKRSGTSLDMFLARVVERGISKGDIKILQWLYERLGWADDESSAREQGDNNNHIINLNYNIGD